VLAAVDPAKLGLTALPAGSADITRIVLLLGLFGWTTVARIVRAGTMSLKERDFVRAAAALGAGTRAILLRHILPNLSGPLLVAASLAVGHAILAESVLSFLGLGIQPPTASWGNMLTGAQEQVWEAPGLALWPGLLIFATVVAFNLLGDALSERR
jgi:peptide/nickel transport system permease protein